MKSQKTQDFLKSQEDDALPYWLVLNRLNGLGPRRFAQLLEHEKSLSNCFNGTETSSDFSSWCEHHGIKSIVLDWKGVERDLAWIEQPNNHILTYIDKSYPFRLREIASAPPVLFVKGQVHSLNTKQIALVGSRYPTPSGKENAYHFAYELARQGLTITSGLALGIDGESHKGSMAAGGITLAVLGNGLDSVYPPKHYSLAQQIPEKGALISEFPLGTLPKAEHFPRRNRLISALSLGIVVVESAVKSGSLITARYGLEQGKEIFAIPGSIHNAMAKGCHQLIREGAKCVENVEHILEEFPEFISVSAKTLPGIAPVFTEERKQSPLLSHISDICTSVDFIINKTGLTAEKVSSMLLELELQELIASVPGGYIRVAKGGMDE